MVNLDDEWRRSRLSALSEKFGSNAALGRALGYKDGAYVRQMIAGERAITEKTIAKAEQLPGAAGWFDEPASNSSKNVRFSTEADRVEGLAAMGAVPLISWVQAGAWSDAADPYAMGDAESWLPCPAKHGARTYCLRVRGESMFNPGGSPSYANGDIIFVDPDRDAKPGDRVVVRMDDHQEATFKQLVLEDGRMLLKALNPEWKPRYTEINGHATITGVVIGKWVPE